jgi:hypothetical protein
VVVVVAVVVAVVVTELYDWSCHGQAFSSLPVHPDQLQGLFI